MDKDPQFPKPHPRQPGDSHPIQQTGKPLRMPVYLNMHQHPIYMRVGPIPNQTPPPRYNSHEHGENPNTSHTEVKSPVHIHDSVHETKPECFPDNYQGSDGSEVGEDAETTAILQELGQLQKEKEALCKLKEKENLRQQLQQARQEVSDLKETTAMLQELEQLKKEKEALCKLKEKENLRQQLKQARKKVSDLKDPHVSSQAVADQDNMLQRLQDKISQQNREGNGQVIDTVLQRKHKLNAEILDVKRYQECLGRPKVTERKLRAPDPVMLKDVDILKIKFMKHSKLNRDAIALQLSHCYTKITWEKETGVLLECTLTLTDKDCFRVVKQWKGKAVTNFNDFMKNITVNKVSVLQDIWTKVIEELKTVTIENPEMVAIFVDQKEGTVTAVGNKNIADVLSKTIDNIAKKVMADAEVERLGWG